MVIVGDPTGTIVAAPPTSRLFHVYFQHGEPIDQRSRSIGGWYVITGWAWLDRGEKMGTAKLLYQISTAIVLLLFIFAGLIKVFPGLNPVMHDEMVSYSLSSTGLFTIP